MSFYLEIKRRILKVSPKNGFQIALEKSYKALKMVLSKKKVPNGFEPQKRL